MAGGESAWMLTAHEDPSLCLVVGTPVLNSDYVGSCDAICEGLYCDEVRSVEVTGCMAYDLTVSHVV